MDSNKNEIVHSNVSGLVKRSEQLIKRGLFEIDEITTSNKSEIKYTKEDRLKILKELEFYLDNHLQLAEIEKTLANAYGEITGQMDSQHVESSHIYGPTIKWVLEGTSDIKRRGLVSILKDLKNLLPADASSSPHLLELNSLIVDAMKFIQTTYVDRDSFDNISNAYKLKGMLIEIVNAINDIRTHAETKLISLIQLNQIG